MDWNVPKAKWFGGLALGSTNAEELAPLRGYCGAGLVLGTFRGRSYFVPQQLRNR